jgi:hypothetical protein
MQWIFQQKKKKIWNIKITKIDSFYIFQDNDLEGVYFHISNT